MNDLFSPAIHIAAIDREMLNQCLVAWEHKMGIYARPSYAIEAHHALFHHGQPVAVTAASETVRETIGDTGLRRSEVVELARLCACRRDLCRPMLRLWRELLWPDIAAAHGRDFAVSYQDEALHSGDVYRFDGWLEVGRGGRGGSDSRTGRPGRKLKIWAWPRGVAAVIAERASR